MITKLYSLSEFIQKYDIKDTYGSYVAYTDVDYQKLERIYDDAISINTYSLSLTQSGRIEYKINGRKVNLMENDMILMPPHNAIQQLNCSTDALSSNLLIEANYYDELLKIEEKLDNTIPVEVLTAFPVFSLKEEKAQELRDLFRQIQRTIQMPHLYKDEMLKYLIHVCQLFINELIQGNPIATHDFKHKENIFKIFIHLAANNFKKERQVRFYADRLNITTTYLSRTVKEVSGNTVLNYLTNFLYNESCRLLSTTPMTMSEISEELNFNDQSAFTNFFKSRSGMSPINYRNSGGVK